MALTYLRPDADVSDGNWTDAAGGTSLFGSIDETALDDADYIKSGPDPSVDVVRLRLSNPTGALVEPCTLRYRYEKTGSSTASLTVRLVQGASTVIATWTDTDVSTSFVTAEQTLTTPQFEAITDFDDLFIELEASAEIMSLITIPGGLYYPGFHSSTYGGTGMSGGGGITLDAVGEFGAMIGQLYIEGRAASKTIDTTGSSSIGFRLGSANVWANAGSTVEIGIQGVLTGSGPAAQPDGTFSVSLTMTGGAGLTASAWNIKVPTSGTATLNHGQMIAVVWEMTARGGTDAVVLATGGVATTGSEPFNQFSNDSGATWLATGHASSPNCVITFSDGTLGVIDFAHPFAVFQLFEAFNSGSTPDERGMLFQVPFNCEVDGAFAFLSLSVADGTPDYDMVLYADPLGTPSALATVTKLAEQSGSGTGARRKWAQFSTPIALTKDTDYVIAIKTSSTTNMSLGSNTFGAAGHRALLSYGLTGKKATRSDGAGAFTAESTPITIYEMGVRICSFMTN